MTHDLIPGSFRRRVRIGARNGGVALPPSADAAFPLVIRPAPLHLVDVERRIRQDESFARLLREQPEFRSTIARAVHARDAAAKHRFESPTALADHLKALRAE